ncbi:MAG: trypsin-like peptidase domain-containing protein [Clostridiales bacterium]|nr:trypsin-like peptidase domain-containing protein [Clostridiales bacterium]
MMKIDEMKNETAGIPAAFNEYCVSGPDQPVQNGKEQKEKKEKKSVGMKTVAWACAICIVLSGAFAFGGTFLANRMTAQEPSTAAAEVQTEKTAVTDSPVVIYKSADTVNTAAGRQTSVSGGELTYAEAAALVKDSVVEIKTEISARNPYFPQFIEQASGAGSGVILSADGHIVTNAHVITNETTGDPADSVTVRLTNGEEYAAEITAYDTDEDIAILKIDAEGLTPAKCGDSDKLVVGEELLIVGNPLGELGGTVTNGIVSATEREIQIGGVYMHLIQTNAAVNPGNSGGGMFNLKGELVGIVNAKSTGTGIEGLGFAIPVNQVMKVSEQLMTDGYVSGKPMIGVSFEDVSDSTGLSFFFGGGSTSDVKAGVYVRGLVEGMNDKVLKEGDRVIAVNGEEISSSKDIKAIVMKSSIGDKLTFQLYRDKKLMEVEVTVYERTPDVGDAAVSLEEKKSDGEQKTKTTKPVIGVSLQESPGGYAKEGVYVAELEEGMNDKVLEVGDRIVAINGDEITSIADVKAIVESATVGDKLNFQVSRDGRLIPVEVTVFERTVEEAEEEDKDDKKEKKEEDHAASPEEDVPGEDGAISGFGDLFDFFKKYFGGR